MAEMPTVTPSRLWKRMTADQRRRAASALWGTDEAASEQRQAVALVAKQMKFRPKTVSGLDAERKARYLASVPELPDDIAAKLLILYHLAEQRPMMSAFLDALGLTHDNGMIEHDEVTPDPAKLAAAAATIGRAYPAEDVALYLNTLRWQDPVAWSALEGVPEAGAPIAEGGASRVTRSWVTSARAGPARAAGSAAVRRGAVRTR